MITKLERDNLLHQNPNKKCKVVIYDDDFQKKELCINCIFEIRMNIKRQILVKEKKKKKTILLITQNVQCSSFPSLAYEIVMIYNTLFIFNVKFFI